MDEGNFDVVTVGAGIAGIAFARTYLEVHPKANLVILEEEDGPGGVWSRARSYPGFWSQTGLGMTEFSDRPMTVPEDAKLIFNMPEAKYITDYLESYCDNHVYDGKTLRDRMVFNCEALSIAKISGVWHVQSRLSTNEETVTFRGCKLVMASGIYRLPNMPDLPGSEHFNGRIIHQKHLGRSKVLDDPNVKSVIVMGGAKSAGDIAYASVKAGKTTSWLLRESGSGAASFSEPKGILHYRNAPEIASTRLISLFTPGIYTPETWFSKMFHGTAWGRTLMRSIFNMTDKGALAYGNFRAREGAREGFHKLESNPDYFWLNGFVGMAQQPDFWQQIAENVDVYRSDVAKVESDSVKLRDGTTIPADAILCGTGFDRSFSMFTSPNASQLGLPVRKIDKVKDDIDWDSLEKAADESFVHRFPGLANPPPRREGPTTPYRLYNLMAPLDDNSVVFLGHLGTLNAFYTAECQALWTTAYFDKKFQRPSREDQIQDIAMMNAFSKRRYPFLGYDGAAVNYDMIGYCRKLLDEVGLKSHIPSGWWDYWFGVCNAASLRGTTEEYLRLHGEDAKGAGS